MSPIIESLLMVGVGALTSFGAAAYWFAKEARRNALNVQLQLNEKLTIRITELEKQSSLLSQTVLPMSTAFQTILIKELTHYHTPVMDALMKKVGPPYSLNDDEEERLIVALKERTEDLDDRISESERDAATMLPMLMKRVKAEAKALEGLTLVSLPTHVLEHKTETKTTE